MFVKSHLHARDKVDWRAILDAPDPTPPKRSTDHADPAHMALFEYEPGLLDRALFLSGRKRARLRQRLEEAQRRDDAEHAEAVRRYEDERAASESRKALARRVLEGDREAYREAFVAEAGVQESLPVSAATLVMHEDDDGRIEVEADVVAVRFDLPTHDVVVNEDGSLFANRMGKSEQAAFFEDYVCSALLRMAREVLAVLPVDGVRVTVSEEVLNTATGHNENVVLAWAYVDRETLESLNLSLIDPSDALPNFPGENRLSDLNPWSDRRRVLASASPATAETDHDDLTEDAAHLVVSAGMASISMLQMNLSVEYRRAARIMEQLEGLGVVGPFKGEVEREVLMGPGDLPLALHR